MHGGPHALVVGESLVDVVRTGDDEVDRPGGSAANTAVALARLGRPTRLATSYAADPFGRMLGEHLAESGVELAGDPLVLERTSVARAVIDETGAASYDFDLTWRLGRVGETGAVHVVHVGSFAPMLDPGREDVLALLDRLPGEVVVTYDVNVRPAITGTGPDVVERVEQMVARADLVKASDEDLHALWPDLDLGAAADRLLALGAVAVVVTRGAAGATWHATGSGGVAAAAVEVVDTIGAGDTFAAALLDALWEHLGAGGRERLVALGAERWEAALGHAVRCAAVTVSRPGADPPWRHELG